MTGSRNKHSSSAKGRPQRPGPQRSEDISGQQLPCDVYAEKNLLGALLIDGAALEQISLEATDFYDPAHQLVFSALSRLHREGIPLEVNFLARELSAMTLAENQTAYDSIGGAACLYELAGVSRNGASPLPENVVYHAQAIREKAQQRRLAEMGLELARRAHNATRPADLLQFVYDQAADIQERGAVNMGFETLDGMALDALEEDLEYLVEGTLVARQPTILAGPKKSLKTSIGLDLALSLATGTPFLGQLPVHRRCRVLFCSGESGLPTLRETARRICAAKNVALSEIEAFHVTSQLPRLSNAESMLSLRITMKRAQAEVVFVDPAYLCIPPADTNNLFAVGQYLLPFSQLCQEHGTTPIVCHHAKRQTGRDKYTPPELEDIAWAGFSEWTRQWFLLDRREPYQPGTGVHRLWLSVGGSAGHSALWGVDISEGTRSTPGGRFWEVAVNSADEAVKESQRRRDASRIREQEDRDAEDRRRIVKVLRTLPDGETQSVLAGLAGLSGKRAGKALTSLLGEGRVKVVTIRKHTRNETAYKHVER